MIAVGLSTMPSFARIVRAAVLSIRDSEFIEAAVAIGDSTPAIILHNILPNCMAPIIVQATLGVASAILSAAASASWAWVCSRLPRNGAPCSARAAPTSTTLRG